MHVHKFIMFFNFMLNSGFANNIKIILIISMRAEIHEKSFEAKTITFRKNITG